MENQLQTPTRRNSQFSKISRKIFGLSKSSSRTSLVNKVENENPKAPAKSVVHPVKVVQPKRSKRVLMKKMLRRIFAKLSIKRFRKKSAHDVSHCNVGESYSLKGWVMEPVMNYYIRDLFREEIRDPLEDENDYYIRDLFREAVTDPLEMENDYYIRDLFREDVKDALEDERDYHIRELFLEAARDPMEDEHDYYIRNLFREEVRNHMDDEEDFHIRKLFLEETLVSCNVPTVEHVNAEASDNYEWTVMKTRSAIRKERQAQRASIHEPEVVIDRVISSDEDISDGDTPTEKFMKKEGWKSREGAKGKEWFTEEKFRKSSKHLCWQILEELYEVDLLESSD